MSTGTALLTARSHGIQAVNALGVFELDLFDSESGAHEENIDPGVYPGTLTLITGGRRQLKVTGAFGDNITVADTGTRYFVGNPDIATITPDGLVIALAEGMTTLSIVNDAGQRDIELRVQVPSTGPTLVNAEDGGAVSNAQGAMVLVGPGVLSRDTTVSITTLSQADLPLAAPGSPTSQYGVIPTSENIIVPRAGLEFAGAFQLNLGERESNQPVQLAIPVATSIAAGTEVFFYRYVKSLDDHGIEQPLWLLVENGVVGDDGMARTSSPPYSGVSATGTYIVSTARRNEEDGSVEIRGGELNVGLALFTGGGGLSLFQYRFDKVYRRDLTLTPTGSPEPAIVNVDAEFPSQPSGIEVPRPRVSQASLGVDGRTLTLDGQNFVGSIFVRFYIPNVAGEPRQTDMAATHTETGLSVEVPEGYPLAVTDIQVVRKLSRSTEQFGTSGEQRQETVELRSNLVSLDTTKDATFVALRDKISVLRPGAGGMNIAAEIQIPEGLYGFRTTPIAFKADNSLGFVAGHDGYVYAIDMVSYRLLQKFQIAGGSASTNITSLAISGNRLYVAEGDRYKAGAHRLISVDINPASEDFLKQSGMMELKNSIFAEASFGFYGIATSADGRYLVATAPTQPLRLAFGDRSKTGSVFVIDLDSISPTGTIDRLEIVAFPSTGGIGMAPVYVEASSDKNRFLLSTALDYNRGFYDLEIIRNQIGGLSSVAINQNVAGTYGPDSSALRLGSLQQFHQLNIQRSSGIAVTSDQQYAFVADYNLKFLDPNLTSGSHLPRQIGGKIGIIADPFGPAPRLVGVTTPIDEGSIDHLELSADGRYLIASLVKWEGASGLLTWSVDQLIDTVSNPAFQSDLNRQGLDTINSAALPTFQPFGWVYGIVTDPLRAPDLEVEGNLGDVIEVDILKAKIKDADITVNGQPFTGSFESLLRASSFGNTVRIAGVEIASIALSSDPTFRVAWNWVSSADDDVGAVLATEPPSNNSARRPIGDGETLSLNLDTTFDTKKGKFYVVPTITQDQLNRLRRGEMINDHTDGTGTYTIEFSILERGKTVPEKKTLTGNITVNINDAEHGTFFGDRPLYNPGYSEFSLTSSGTVGVNQGVNEALDVYRVEQRLKYLGFSAMTASNSQGIPTRTNNQMQEFDVDGVWTRQDALAAWTFNQVVNYSAGNRALAPHGTEARGTFQASYYQDVGTRADQFLIGGANSATFMNYLNAYNAPHWMEIFEARMPTDPSLPGWTNTQRGVSAPPVPGTTGAVERFGTSWLRDLMVARQFASAGFGVGTRLSSFTGAVDANHGFTPRGHLTHDLGMAFDLGIGRYISERRLNPNPPPNTLPGNQFSTLPEVISGTNQPLILNLPAQGWIDNANAISQVGGLLESNSYIRILNNVPQDFGRNLQQSAAGDFLSIYSITRDNGLEAHGLDDLRLTNNDPRVRSALFGDGTAGGSLISQVHIGGVGSQNAYTNLSSVLTNLEVQNTPAPFHQNHFHVYLRVPTLQPIVENLKADEDNSVVPLYVPSDANSLEGFLQSDTTSKSQFEGEIMRDLLITALIASTSPTVLAQVSPSTGHYDKTNTYCQDVESLPADSGFNNFYPIAGVISVPLGISLKEWAAQTGLKVTEVESPKHGSVTVVDSSWYQYRFIPDKDYLGKDRVVYEIEQQGKRYKVTINFWIVPVVRDSMSEEGEEFIPECESQDFSGSGIGSSGPVSSGYSVAEYLFGHIPLGSDFVKISFSDLPGSVLGQAGGDTIVLDSSGGAYGWFLDATPWDNQEFLPTSNPNEFIARAGSVDTWDGVRFELLNYLDLVVR